MSATQPAMQFSRNMRNTANIRLAMGAKNAATAHNAVTTADFKGVKKFSIVFRLIMGLDTNLRGRYYYLFNSLSVKLQLLSDLILNCCQIMRKQHICQTDSD